MERDDWPAIGFAIDELDRTRAQEYALLSTLLSHSPDAATVSGLALLEGSNTPLGAAHAALGAAAVRVGAGRAAQEYAALFVGVGPSELLPYASYYLTGFLHGRPLAQLRQTLRQLGIARVEGQAEPEDHAATVLEIMSGLAGGDFAAPAGTERSVFDSHVAPWMGRFFSDLERSKSVDFYARVGTLGRTFLAIESESFTLNRG